MALELLDPRKNWAKIKSANNGGGPLFKSAATQPKLRAASAINPMVSESLTDGMKGAFSGKTFNQRKR